MLEALDGLIESGHVARHPRRPGQKEDRYEQRLGSAAGAAAGTEAGAAIEPPGEVDGPDRLGRLERELAELRGEVSALREALGG